jgi:CheY-like chemotaxis protein
MKDLSVLYFDDSIADRDSYSKRLERGPFRVTSARPPSDLALATATSQRWDLVLVDRELEGGGRGADRVNYQGTTLATAFKDLVDDVPVVLFTTEDLLSPQDARRLLDSSPIFDDVLYKGIVDQDPPEAIGRLERLCAGFRDLREANRDWPSLIGLLAATEAEAALLQEAGPPLIRGQWPVSEAARWLERTVLEYPGILYGARYGAALLGVSVGVFMDERLKALLEPCCYRGVLQPSEGRWWRGRLAEMAFDVAGEAALEGPITEAFPNALDKLWVTTVERSICSDCGEAGADTVCAVLEDPVKTEHSLAYYPDRRPAVMETARVSFRAIRESNDVDEDLIDPNARDLVVRLQAKIS